LGLEGRVKRHKKDPKRVRAGHRAYRTRLRHERARERKRVQQAEKRAERAEAKRTEKEKLAISELRAAGYSQREAIEMIARSAKHATIKFRPEKFARTTFRTVDQFTKPDAIVSNPKPRRKKGERLAAFEKRKRSWAAKKGAATRWLRQSREKRTGLVDAVGNPIDGRTTTGQRIIKARLRQRDPQLMLFIKRARELGKTREEIFKEIFSP
jgi:hypothetical protein